MKAYSLDLRERVVRAVDQVLRHFHPLEIMVCVKTYHDLIIELAHWYRKHR